MIPLILSFKQVIFQKSSSRKCLITKTFSIFYEGSLSTNKTLYLFSFQTIWVWGTEIFIRLGTVIYCLMCDRESENCGLASTVMTESFVHFGKSCVNCINDTGNRDSPVLMWNHVSMENVLEECTWQVCCHGNAHHLI